MGRLVTCRVQAARCFRLHFAVDALFYGVTKLRAGSGPSIDSIPSQLIRLSFPASGSPAPGPCPQAS